MGTLEAEHLFELIQDSQYDGKRRNIVGTCPFCGKQDKFGISIVKDGNPWQCFSNNCPGGSGRIYKLLNYLGRLDLIKIEGLDTTWLENKLEKIEYQELDLDLPSEDLPEGYKRVADDAYLNGRGWTDDDYFYFEAGKTKNWLYTDYIILPIKMEDRIVGYVSRHIWSKSKIDNHNNQVKRDDKGYLILRYRNSSGNDMSKMLYGFDKVIPGVTDTVILVEGAFDVFNVTRCLDLYENDFLKCVATFGKKISEEQIYWLQEAGVRNLVILFDPDAMMNTKYKSKDLNKYFNVLVGHIEDNEKDAGDLSVDEMLDLMDNLYTPVDFAIEKVVMRKLKG